MGRGLDIRAVRVALAEAAANATGIKRTYSIAPERIAEFPAAQGRLLYASAT